MSCLAKGTAVFPIKGHSTSGTICVPLRLVVILDSHKMVYDSHIKVKQADY